MCNALVWCTQVVIDDVGVAELEDANLLLSLLEQHGSLVTLNMIPVTVEDAQSCKAELV